jgi:hypothetical protein
MVGFLGLSCSVGDLIVVGEIPRDVLLLGLVRLGDWRLDFVGADGADLAALAPPSARCATMPFPIVLWFSHVFCDV